MAAKRPIEVGDPVYVEWTDASRSAFEWIDGTKIDRHIDGSEIIRSLGFVARLDDEQLSLIHNASESQVLFVTNIPRGMVQKLRRVR